MLIADASWEMGKRALRSTVRRFPGRAALALVAGDRSLWVRAHERFPAASVIKIGILLDLHSRVAEGLVDLSDTVSLREADRTEGSGVLAGMTTGIRLTLADLAHLMIVVSDNTASNMLIDRLGAEAINARLAGWGCVQTQLQRRFFDLAARARGLDNWVSAQEMSSLLWRLAVGELLPPIQTEQCLTILKNQQFRDRIPALLPSGVPVGNKTGSISGVCHDAAIIFAPAGPFALTILTADQPSQPIAEAFIRRTALRAYRAIAGPG